MRFFAKSDATIGGGVVGKEGGIIVDYDVSSSGVGTTLIISLDYCEEWVVGLLELLFGKVANGGEHARQKWVAPPAATGGRALPIR